MKIGVMVESFRLGLEGGLKAAAEVGVHGVQIYATGGEMHPDKLSQSRRKELKQLIADLGLEVAALCADFGGHGFMNEATNRKRIEDSAKVLALALELGSKVATTHIGVVPADPKHPRRAILAKAMAELAKTSAKIGGTFAIETGPEPSTVLKSFFEELGNPKGLGVNLDPANLAMVCREDSTVAVANLGRYIVHTHAKDGVNVQPFDPERLYNPTPEDAKTNINWNEYFREVPLGEGQVDFPKYIAALRKAGFDGYLTIEREVGANPRADIEKAVSFLRDMV